MKSFKHLSLACMLAGLLLQGHAPAFAQAVPAKAAMADEAGLRQKLMGTWELDYGGMAVTFVFGDKSVNVMGTGDNPYVLKGDQLSFEVMGNRSAGKLTFSSDKEMQLETADGKQIFKRIP